MFTIPTKSGTCMRTHGTVSYPNCNSISEATHSNRVTGAENLCFSNPMCGPSSIGSFYRKISRKSARLQGVRSACRCTGAVRTSVRRGPGRQWASRSRPCPKGKVVLGFLRHCQGTYPTRCLQKEEEESERCGTGGTPHIRFGCSYRWTRRPYTRHVQGRAPGSEPAGLPVSGALYLSWPAVLICNIVYTGTS